jgi:hypothetical protein
MSDLSVPPLSLVPLHDEPAPSSPRLQPFAWPTPALPAYPAAQADGRPVACAVEGANGQRMQGRLIAFDPQQGVATVIIPPARTPMPLRFTQFRRLHLLPPLQRLPLDPQRTTPLDLIDRMTQSYCIRWHQGEPSTGDTVTCEQTDQGLYLFEPEGTEGAVRRSFVPRSAFGEFEFGGLIGQALVEQQAATAEAVDAALAEQARLRERKLGEMLVVRKIIKPTDLVRAIEEQSRMPMVRIGEALMALGSSPSRSWRMRWPAAHDRTVPLGELLVRRGMVSRARPADRAGAQDGLPAGRGADFEVEAEALATACPSRWRSVCRRCR